MEVKRRRRIGGGVIERDRQRERDREGERVSEAGWADVSG